MSNWSPVPRRPLLNEGIFAFDEKVEVVNKSVSAIEYQRSLDGTPITRTPPSAVQPAGRPLVLSSDKINKSSVATAVSAPVDSREEKVDPAAVVKAYLAHRD